MIGRVIVAGLASLVALDTAWGGEIGLCTEPFAYDSAVNLYVVEDAEQGADEGLRDVRRRLAWLVKLDALFGDSYGSLGVHFLRHPEGEPCTLDSIVQRTALVLPPQGAAAFVDQRVYSEENQILLQSYLRFFRVGSDGQIRTEIVELTPQDAGYFSEELPAQHVAFPPQQLTSYDLATIERAFAEASLLYTEPDLESNAKPLPFSLDEPLPFLVTEVRLDGWMRVDATPFNQDLQGWLRADPKVSAWARSLLPELELLKGAVGYLSWLQARDSLWLEEIVAPSIIRRASQALESYALIEPKLVSADIGLSAAFAESLRAAMAVEDSGAAGALLPSFIQVVQRSLPDSRVRNLLGMARLAACCLEQLPELDAMRQAARIVGMAGALNDFQAALVIDPGNVRALANLKAVYALLEQTAELPLDAQAPADASTALQEAYARSLSRLPTTHDDLAKRIEKIRALRPDEL